MLIKNLRKICIITGAFVLLAIIYLIIASPVYESESLLRIKQPKGLGDSILDAVPGASTTMTAQIMSTDAEILKSRSVVEPVIAATEMADKDGKYPKYDDYVKERIATTPFKNTEILKLAVTAKSPEAAQRANKLIVEGFLDRLTELSRSEQRVTKEFIAGRVVESRAELDKAEAKLQDYKKENHILTPSDSAKILADRLTLVDTVNAQNQVDMATAQARLAAINDQLGGEGASTADSSTIKQYNSKLAELEMTRIGYLNKYTNNHPVMQALDKEIAGVKVKLRSEIQKAVSLQAPTDNPVHQGLLAGKFQSEAEIEIAQKKIGALAELEKTNKKELESLSSVEQGYLRLERDANVAQEIYVMLAKRLEEAKVAEVMVSNEVQVVDTATLPEKSVKPRKGLTLVLSLLLGIMAGCGYTLAYEMLNRKIRTAEDVQSYLGLPVLGSVPDIASIDRALADRRKKPNFYEKIRRLLQK
jgi:polysaccharide biosynthesis transport protein